MIAKMEFFREHTWVVPVISVFAMTVVQCVLINCCCCSKPKKKTNRLVSKPAEAAERQLVTLEMQKIAKRLANPTAYPANAEHQRFHLPHGI
ncbi:hypothetical protein L596_030274 [Steinernema carpocapsae]|uniref:Uncharacterized protein n=1 Tax=Steinernema carpocapsae TaxID=34508 RepID=A0A4U5LNX3_STECR|nr:hypothetical protein L596_030274 [Steinernema carpocapsae]